MKFLKSKFFIICLVLTLVIALVSGIFAAIGFTGPLKAVFGTVATPFRLLGSLCADAVNGAFGVFEDYGRLESENESLKAELESYKDADYEMGRLEEENEWLKDYIGVATSHPDFALRDAKIIARSTDSYTETLTLDCGSVHGIKKDMPVICENGLFGHVTEVGLDWCYVESIIETSSSVGVIIERSAALGVAEGDVTLRTDGECRMKLFEASADVRVGDRVYTSGGEGSIYPSGIYFGEVVDIKADTQSRTLTAIIKTGTDFTSTSRVNRVMIVTGYDGGASA